MTGERNVTADCWGLRVYTQARRGAALGLNGGRRARRVQGWQRSTLEGTCARTVVEPENAVQRASEESVAWELHTRTVSEA